MERSILEQVNVESMSARLNSRNVKPVYFPNFFGLYPTEILKWETLIGEKGVPVMADVISYDAESPIKTREVINKMSGDIPKSSISRKLNEQEVNKYKTLMHYANGNPNKKELLDLVFNDLDFCYNGVRARMEQLSMQIMSTAALSLSKTVNNGIITESALDFGVPADNKFGVTDNWSVAASATPLKDIDDLTDAASEKGITLKHVIMRKSDFINLRNATDTVNKIKAWVNTKGNLLVTKDTINQYLIANDLPTIVVVNPSVRFEDEDHARTTINPWQQYRVVGVPDLKIGDVQHGPLAAEGDTEVAKVATMVKKDFVLASKWGSLNPYTDWTMAEANAFPVLNDPDGLFYLRVDNSSW